MKKNIELVKQESAKLYQEIIDNGYSEELAKHISDELSTKGGYLFNKSHSYSYAVLCLQTAYLKAHYPVYFFSALFNMNKNKPGMVNKHILDAKQFNVEILPPNINNSQMNFSVVDNKILFGLSAISGIGETVARAIIDDRNYNGKFKNFSDFTTRIAPTKAQTINLVKSGAIPTKNKKRFLMTYFENQFEQKEYKPVSSYGTKLKLINDWGIDVNDYLINKKVDKEAVLNVYNQKRKEKFLIEQAEKHKEYINECTEKYLQDEEFWEFETLQFFITQQNPFEKAYEILPTFEDIPIGNQCVVVGIVSRIQKKKTKTGQQFAFVNIYGTNLLEATVWPETLKKYQPLIVKGQQVAILCRKEAEDKVVVDKIRPYNEWIQQYYV